MIQNILKSSFRIFTHSKLAISHLAEKYATENKIEVSKILGSGEKGKILLWDVKAHVKPQQFRFRKNSSSVLSSRRKGKLTFEAPPNKTTQPTSATGAVKIYGASMVENSHSTSATESHPPNKGSAIEIINNKHTNIPSHEEKHKKMQIPHFYIHIECDLSALGKTMKLKEDKDFIVDKIAIQFILRCVGRSLQEIQEFSIVAHKGKFYQHSGFKLISHDLSNSVPTQTFQTSNLNLEKLMTAAIYFSTAKKLRKIAMPIDNHSNFTMGVGTPVIKPCVSKDGGHSYKSITELTFVFDHQTIDGAIGAQFASKVKQYIQNPYLIA